MTTAQDGPVATLVIPLWTLADRLRKVRREVAQAEQIEFARQLEVGAPTYAAWESGRTQPRNPVALAKRVEVATGVPASWMLGLDEPAPLPPGDAPSRQEGAGVNGGQLRTGRERVNGGGVVMRPLVGAPPATTDHPAAAQLEVDDAGSVDRAAARSPFAPGPSVLPLSTAVPA